VRTVRQHLLRDAQWPGAFERHIGTRGFGTP
jgi:hypothetical protein